MSASGTEFVISQVARTRPQALELAELLAPAVRAEGALVRRLRIELLPHLSADAEAALWFSPLVQAHSADGITLSVPIAVALRRRLARQWQTKRRSLLEQARAIYAEVHVGLPPPLRLEEEIAWCLVAGDEDRINAQVDSAIAAVISDSDRFRFWATQATARLPDGIRVANNGIVLARASTEKFTGRVWEAAYRTLKTKPLVVRHTGFEIEFGGPIGPGSRRIDVPDATAVPLILHWPSAEGTAAEDVIVDGRDDAVPVRVNVSGHVEVRTPAGITYIVRDDPFERPSSIDPAADPLGELRSMLASRRISGLRLAEPDEAAEIGVELQSGRVTLVDAAGQLLPAVPQLDPRKNGLAAHTAALAAHVSRWLTVAELRSESPVLAGTVEVAVARVGTGPDRNIVVAPIDSVIATITNLGSEPLFVAVLALSSDWSVGVLTEGKTSSTLDPGARWEGRLQLDVIAPGHDEGFVRVVGVAARHPFDPRPLMLSAIGQAGRDRPPVAASTNPSLEVLSLDAEFAVMTGAPNVGLDHRYLEWITSEAVVHVRSPLSVDVSRGEAGPTAAPSPLRSATADSVRWASRFASWITGAVAVDGGRLVVACLNGTVTVLRTADGKAPEGWGEPVNMGAALHAGPLLLPQSDGHACAYVGAADGRLHAIDLASGRDRVIVEAAAAIEGTPVSVGERICALSADGRVHSVDPSSGERKVLFETSAEATGALSAVFGTIFVTDTDGWVHAIDANAGGRKWRSPTDGLVLSAPLPVAVWLYVCGTDGVLQEIGISDGRQRAMAKLGAPVHVAPVRDGNLLYVGSSDGVVHAFDIGHRGPERLEAIWRHPLGEEIAGLAASGGRVYVAAGSRLVEVNSATRQERELLRMECLIGTPPVISGRHCYVVGLGGVIICMELSNSWSDFISDHTRNNQDAR
jgi:outer membrane protein assembly factor BamB